MTRPRHLWSGDWLEESQAARDRLAGARLSQPGPEQPEPASTPDRAERRSRAIVCSLLALVLAGWRGLRHLLRRRRLRAVAPSRPRRLVIAALAVLLLSAGLTVAVEAISASSPGASGRPWLGVELTTSITQPGALVMFVVQGGPADRAGIELGDVIDRIGGRAVSSPQGVTTALSGLRPGERVRVRIERFGQALSGTVTLGRRPSSP
jgi:PDZ domain